VDGGLGCRNESTRIHREALRVAGRETDVRGQRGGTCGRRPAQPAPGAGPEIIKASNYVFMHN
jgi:hypothetical protein